MKPGLAKKLVLINPKCGSFLIRNIALLVEKWFPPLSLLTLAGLTPKDYEIAIYNLKTIWPRRLFRPGILVGITCFSSNAPLAYRLARRYKEAGASVVMGGPHVSALPQEALPHCHSVVVGEAESVWQEVVRDYEEGVLKPVYQGEPLEDFFSPVFDYFLTLPPLSLQAGIQTTRGCKNACEYCVISNRPLRCVKPEQVVALVSRVKSAISNPLIYFKDDNIFSQPDHARQLFRMLAPQEIQWVSFSSIDIARDPEALQLARASGCVELTIGFETLEVSALEKAAAARVTDPHEYLVLLRKIQAAGIRVRGAFMLGFDHEQPADYLRLVIFWLRAHFFLVVLGIITPYPGTVLSRRWEAEGRVLHHNWEKYNCLHTVFKPRHLPPWGLSLWFVVLRIISLFLATQTQIILAAFFTLLIANIYLLFFS